MKTPVSFSLYRHNALASMLALTALFALTAPDSASANTTKDTTIVNIATVAYKDTAGQGNFSAHAASKVTVNLVAAAPSLYNAPSGGASPGSPDCPPVLDYASGSTVTRIYALAAQANGVDTYTLSVADYAAGTANLTASNRIVSTLKTDGTGTSAITGIDVTPAGSRDLGSAIPIGFSGANVLQFPGGSLTNQQIAVGDIVLVEIGPVGSKVKKLFQVTAKFNGTAHDHTYADGAAHTDASGTDTPEAIGTLTLGALPDATLYGQTFGGGNTAPAFNVAATEPTIGVPVGEVVFLKVDVSASTNVQAPATTATAGFTLNTEDPTPKTCTVDHFQAPTLSITKEVRRYDLAATTWGSFGATASGNPGDWLEYRVTVANSGIQAGSVNVSDAVPKYTTLINGASAYGGTDGTGAAGDIFATISSYDDSATPVLIQTVNVKMTTAATQPASPLATVGFGTAGGTTATSSLAFYMGDSSAVATGGKIPSCSDTNYTTKATCDGASKDWITSYKILYRVKID